MSFTNQTQHYGLPQYVGTDVPAYLTDYNGAMATIDQGMNAAKTQADAAATAAGQAANDITALNSTVQTQATQISAAAQAASAAQTTANGADEKADDLDVRVTALETAGGGLTVVDTNYTGAVNTAAGSLFLSQAINIQHPAGKTADDLISLFLLSPGGQAVKWLSGFFTTTSNIFIYCYTAQASTNYTIRAIYK